MNKITIRVSVRTDNVGSKCTGTIACNRDKWESMSDDKQEEYCRDFAFDMVEWNYKEVAGSENQ